MIQTEMIQTNNLNEFRSTEAVETSKRFFLNRLETKIKTDLKHAAWFLCSLSSFFLFKNTALGFGQELENISDRAGPVSAGRLGSRGAVKCLNGACDLRCETMYDGDDRNNGDVDNDKKQQW